MGYPAGALELAPNRLRSSYNLGSSSATGGAGILKLVHLAIAAQLLLGGCASLPQACLPPARPMISAELFFGRSVGNRVVTGKQFATFLATVITPRFPDGLTVLDAQGQWRNRDSGAIAHEASKLVKIIFADDAAKRAALDAIAASYKLKFHQQSVLISLQPVCAAF